MTLTFDRKKLTDAVAKVAGVGADRAARVRPVLGNVLFTPGDDTTISATNCEQSAVIRGLGAMSGEPFLLNTNKLLAALRSCADDQIEMRHKPTGIELLCGRARWSLLTASASDFPPMDQPLCESPITLPAEAARKLLSFAWLADDDSSRYALGSLFIESGGKDITSCSTDGRAIVWCEIPIECPVASCLIPAQATRGIAQSLPEAGVVQLHITPNCAAFVSDECSYWTRQIEGRFPKWREWQSTHGMFDVEIPHLSLMLAIQQASITAGDGTSNRIRFRFVADRLSLACRSSELGESEAEVPINWPHAPTEVEVSRSYAAEIVQRIKADTLRLWVNGHTLSVRSGPIGSLIMGMGDPKEAAK